MKLLPYVLTVGLFGQAWGVSMSSRFTLDSTCTSARVDAMLTETIDMVNTAMTGINTLLNAGTKLNPLRQTTEIESLLFAAKTAWGVADLGIWTYSLPAADSAALKGALANYQKLYDALNSGSGIRAASQNTLFCDDTNLEWTTTAAAIFAEASSKPAMTTTEYFQAQGYTGDQLDIVKGLWKDPNHTRGKDSNYIIDEYNGRRMCGANTAQGITYWTSGNMILCPSVFVNSNFKTSLSSMRTSTVEIDWNDLRSLPGVFLHEMMHFLDLTPHVTDKKVPGHPTETAYGPLRCYVLAGSGGSETVDRSAPLANADSYTVFATLAYVPGAKILEG